MKTYGNVTKRINENIWKCDKKNKRIIENIWKHMEICQKE